MFGLRLSAPWLNEADPDVTIHVARRDDPDLEAHTNQLSAAQRSESFAHLILPHDRFYLHWRDLLDVVVDAPGAAITIRELGPAGVESFRSHLLGPVLSFILQHRGIEVWHGVAISNGVFTAAIMGDSGAGKSTFAAASLQSGYRVITDDLLIFDASNAGLALRPGPARLKLFPDDARTFLPGERDSLPLNPFTQKRVFPLTRDEHCDRAARVHCILLLNAEAGDRTMDLLHGAAAVRGVLANIFNGLGASMERQQHMLAAATAICLRCSVFQVGVGRNLPALPSEACSILAAAGLERVNSKQ